MTRMKKRAPVQSSDINVVESVDGESKSSAVTKKPAQGFKGNIHAHAIHQPVRDMVTSALKVKASAEGVPLAAIKKYIIWNYNNKKRLGKNMQEKIKEYIAGEFEKGTIVASNTKEKTIKFNLMRFNMADK